MNIKYPENVKTIAQVLRQKGYKAYAVGGCIRDSLMGKIPNDWDMTTSCRPEDMIKIFNDAGFRTIPTGIKHGTVSVLIGGEQYECTSFRIDGEYTDSRHPDKVIFTTDISEDLCRRDFTVNAMAGDPLSLDDDDGVIDLFGGKTDIQNKLVRCVGDAEARFCEDALRILRAVRFATVLDFKIDVETENAAKKLCSRLNSVSAERRIIELKKILLSPYADRGIDLLFGIGAQKYIHDGLKKPIIKLSELPCDFGCRMAALFGTESVPSLSCLKLSKLEERQIKSICSPENYRSEPSKYNARRLISTHGEYAEQASLVRGECALADMITAERKKSPCVKISDLKISGNDLISAGFTPRDIGHIMRKLLDAVLIDPEINQKDKLLYIADDIFKK